MRTWCVAVTGAPALSARAQPPADQACLTVSRLARTPAPPEAPTTGGRIEPGEWQDATTGLEGLPHFLGAQRLVSYDQPVQRVDEVPRRPTRRNPRPLASIRLHPG